MRITIDLTDYLDADDVFEMAQKHGFVPQKGLPDSLLEIEWRKISFDDSEKISKFFEKFKNIPLTDLEEFLEKYL